LKKEWAKIAGARSFVEHLKYNQENRGMENYRKRMAHRAATHKTWRQMKGVEKFMHEINHPGNKPFVIGLAVTSTVMLYVYFSNINNPQAQKESKYYQRFHAVKSHEDHGHGH
jgi:hypothetical protein